MQDNFLPLKLMNVGLTLNHKHCLSDISFNIDHMGVTAIIGENGAGKSLLLKLLAGLIKPTAGEILWQKTPHLKPIPPAITWVPQQAPLLNQSVTSNVGLGLQKSTNKPQRIQAALKWAGLTHISKQPCHFLSTGEKQLVALARAWAIKPKVLLLDEPCANLDIDNKQKMNALIAELSQNNCKVFLTSHDEAQVDTLAEDIVQLHQGKVKSHISHSNYHHKTG